MDLGSQDQEIVRLLAKLKNTGGQYPEHMLVARRQRFLRQMMEIEMGVGAATALKEAAEAANTSAASSATSSATSTLLETALVVAIIVETGAVAYFYRDEIADFFRLNTSETRVQERTEVTPPPAATTSMEILGVTPSPAVTATVPSITLAVSPTDAIVTSTRTPVPGLAEEDNNTLNSTTGGTSQVEVDSTPVPGENNNSGNNNNNGNQGNHYGQTPKPERTLENNGNNNPPSQGEDNSSPNNNGNQSPRSDPDPTQVE
jgi:hypothetical protein